MDGGKLRFGRHRHRWVATRRIAFGQFAYQATSNQNKRRTNKSATPRLMASIEIIDQWTKRRNEEKNKQIHRNRCQWLLLDHVLEQTIRFQCKFIYFFSNMLALFLRMRKKTTRALACVVCRWANQRGVTLQLKTHYRVATFFFFRHRRGWFES